MISMLSKLQYDFDKSSPEEISQYSHRIVAKERIMARVEQSIEANVLIRTAYNEERGAATGAWRGEVERKSGTTA